MNDFHTPILLITFNRPEHTGKVLEAIMAAQPHELFVFQDGERTANENDIFKCAEVRQVVEKRTKETGVILHTFYSKKNLGCGPGPAAAISWFFENVDEGIIIEDDAVPHPDFFPYCEELLTKYRDNNDVRAIGSMNVDTQRWGDGSYYFSMMNRNLCARATWKRSWQSFDISMAKTSCGDIRRALRKYGCGPLECDYWIDRLREVHKNLSNGKSWDMQFFMSIWLNHGKGIIPNVNLSSNIGTVGEATHQMGAGNIIDNVPTSPIMPLVHPLDTNVQSEADRQFHFCYFEPQKATWGFGKTLYFLINKRIKRLVGHEGPWLKRKK